MTNPILKKIQSNGININIAIWYSENNSNENIFCIHGISANCMTWQIIAESLSKYFNIYAIDLRGRGLSDKPEKGYNIQIHCKDIKNTIDKLNIKPVILMGHSLGAYISIIFSTLYPEYVKKLILLDGGGKLTKEQTEKVFSGIKPSLERLGQIFNSFEEYIEKMKKAPFLQPWHQFLEKYFEYEVEKLPNGYIKPLIPPSVIIEEAENLKNEDIEIYYPKIKCPVFVLRANQGMLSNDDILLPENALKIMIEKIPNVEIIDIKGTNHYSIAFYPNERRDKILKKIIES